MKTLNYSLIAAAMILLNGCSLNHQVPKATIKFNPRTHAVDISSHKDVILKGVVIESNRVTITSYEASANVDVVKAAVIAQQQQIQATLDGLNKILTAISGVPIK
jgi:PBP1b-binding outer membrane lipoprotein LpoB